MIGCDPNGGTSPPADEIGIVFASAKVPLVAVSYDAWPAWPITIVRPVKPYPTSSLHAAVALLEAKKEWVPGE